MIIGFNLMNEKINNCKILIIFQGVFQFVSLIVELYHYFEKRHGSNISIMFVSKPTGNHVVIFHI